MLNDNSIKEYDDSQSNEDLGELIKIRHEKLENLRLSNKDPFMETKYSVSHYALDLKNNFYKFEGQTVSIAGRILNFRDMGKASFLNISDKSGDIQVYVRVDNVGEDAYSDFLKFDIGDIVGVYGEVFKTKRGEVSVRVSSITLLSKSLIPLPEKFHGLKDTEFRYRRRYVDLIINKDVRDTFVKRSLIIKNIRNYLDNIGFLEVETPVLNRISGGAAARPFKTYHNALEMPMNLRIAPELHLKRLIVGGFDKVYEIGRVFRNEGISIKHNPEFTIMELYMAYADYNDIMNLTEDLYRYVTKNVLGNLKIEYLGTEIDFEKPFERLSMVDAVKKYANVDFRILKNHLKDYLWLTLLKSMQM